jgi:hypothetical protein
MSQLGQKRRLSDVGMSASPPTSDVRLRRTEPTLGAINVRFASRRTAAKFASLFDEAGGVVRDMTEIDLTGEHA